MVKCLYVSQKRWFKKSLKWPITLIAQTCYVEELLHTPGEKVFSLFCTLFTVFFGSLKFNFHHYLLWVQKNCFLHWSLKSPFYPHHFPHSTIFHTGEWCCEENGLGKILTLHHKRQWWKLILVWPNLRLLLNNVR